MGHDDVRPGRVALFGLDGSRRPGSDHGAARRVIDAAEADVLILGAGGAGLCAALHAADASPKLRVTVVVKGLLGRAGCTRMVQGGYNAVLTEPDSLEAHLVDTLAGGGFINDQELVWALVTEAPRRALELEWRYGCLFDRTREGRIHQKPFAGQSHDRTIHKGDLTGIEIMDRLAEQTQAGRTSRGSRSAAPSSCCATARGAGRAAISRTGSAIDSWSATIPSGWSARRATSWRVPRSLRSRRAAARRTAASGSTSPTSAPRWSRRTSAAWSGAAVTSAVTSRAGPSRWARRLTS